MQIWKGFGDRLKILETEKSLLRKYHLIVNEIDHMSDLYVDSSFHRQSMKYDNCLKKNGMDQFFNRSINSNSRIGGKKT